MINFSLRHPISVIMIYIGFMVCSVFAIRNLSLDFYPEIKSRKILIETEYTGADAETVREMVSVPVENACLAIQDIKNISSISKDGLSIVQLEFHFGTDMNLSLLKTKEIIDGTSEILPYDCKITSVKISDSKENYFQFSISDVKENFVKERFLATDTLRQELLRIKGVAEVNISGGEEEEILIQIDGFNLYRHFLDLRDIAYAYNQTNFNFPVGSVDEGENNYKVKISSELNSENQIGEIMINHSINSGSIKIKDLGKITRNKKQKKSFVQVNGKEKVLVSVKYGAVNPIKVSAEIKKLLKHINTVHNNQYIIDVIEDPSIELRKNLNNMIAQGVAGLIITYIFLSLCFKSFRHALAVIISIPVCMVLTLASLQLSGNTLNEISMSGLTLGIGLIVDCSVIVAERIIDSKDITMISKKIVYSNCGSTATTILSFAPVFLIEGPVKEMFSSLSLAVISCVLFSFFVSFTLTIALIKLLKCDKTNVCYTKNYHKLVKIYSNFLLKVLDKPFFPLFVVIFSGISGLLLMKNQNFSLSGNEKSERINIILGFPSYLSMNYIEKKALELQRKFEGIDFINNVVISADSETSESGITLNSFSEKNLKITLYTNKVKSELLIQELNNIFDDGKVIINSSKSDYIKKSFCNLPGRYVLLEDDILSLNEKTQQLKDEYSFQIQPDERSSNIEFKPSNEMLSKTGISPDYVSNLTYDYLNGIDLNPLKEKDKKIPVRVVAKNNDKNLMDFVSSVYLKAGDTHVPLRSLGSFEKITNEKTYYRENQKDAKIIIPCSNRKLKNPEACEIIDREENQNKYILQECLTIVIFIGILIYIFLAIIFNSFSLPASVILTMFLSIPGSFACLVLFKYSFDLNALISIVILIGLSANNSIIVIEEILGNKNLSRDKIIDSCRQSFSSLVITNGTTILSLVPFIFQSSISISIIGGLLYSFALNLILIPSLLIKKIKQNKNRR